MTHETKKPRWAVLADTDLPHLGMMLLVMIDGQPDQTPDGLLKLHPVIWN